MRSVSSFLVALQLVLTPFFAFGKPDCSSLPPEAREHNPHCAVPMPEHWGTLESVVFFALVLVAFWVVVRLGILRLNEKA
jgi:hypothetical protein